MDNRGLWQAVLGELELGLSRFNFATWFKNTAIVARTDGLLTIAVPNGVTKNWIENKYLPQIKSILAKLEPEVTGVEFKIQSLVDLSKPVEFLNPTVSMATSPNAASFGETATATPKRPSALNERYTFTNFVVGSGNELAYASCQAVAQSPGQKFSPLFIYGGPGLGKSHLAQAVGQAIWQRNPGAKVEYITAEGFTNEFVSSLSSRRLHQFAQKFRQADVLIMDDLQFLAGKQKTQEEFFHTFNALHQNNKQIVLVSDQAPRSIPLMESRLRSRLEWGVTIELETPDSATRGAILETKASAQGYLLPADVVAQMASLEHQNIRELEGTLLKLIAYCELHHMEPSLSVAQRLLQLSAPTRRRGLTPRVVIELVSRYYEVKPELIIGAKRDGYIVLPRQVAMYLMRHDLGMSLPRVAAALGGRDHTTASHGVAKIKRLIGTEVELRADIEALRQQLINS